MNKKISRLAAFVAAFALTTLACVSRVSPAADGDLLDVRNDPESTIKIIFDTDIGGDIDDAFALALLHRFADRGVCELLGVTLTNEEPAAARFVAAENAAFGRPNIPVGLPRDAGRKTNYYPTGTLEQKNPDGSAEYPVPEGFETKDPVALLRELLASAEDASVVVVQVGFSTNLAALLDSPPDAISPLSGKELAAKKVRLLSIMGGAFVFDESANPYRDHKEWNIKNDVPSAKKVAAEWPTEIVFSGYEVGDRIRMSPVNLKRDYRSPRAKFLRDAYEHWANKCAPQEGLNHRRPTWDLTSVLFVVRPEEGRNYYRLSPYVRVDFDDEGATLCSPDPNAKRRAFIQNEIERARVEEAFVNLCSEP